MRIKMDKETDTLYIRFDESPIVESEEVENGIILDLNAEKKVVGIEVLNFSKRVPAEQLNVLQYETT